MSSPRILIGPANYAGQATEFARALGREGCAEARSAELRLPRRPYNFPADIVIPGLRWALDPVWRRDWRRMVHRHCSSVVMDGGLPLTRGGLHWSKAGRLTLARHSLGRDLEELQTDLRVGVLLHGSEIRDPDDHVARYPESVFRSMPADQKTVLSANVATTKAALRDFDGPVFVTTPDLLDDWPSATWTPVIRASAIAQARPPTFRRPRVLAAPTNRALSGLSAFDPVLKRLHSAGFITYVPVSGMSADAVANEVRSSDIVMCKYGLGTYSALAVEAMGAGRLALADVPAHVRARVERQFGELPVMSYDAQSLDSLLRGIIAQPDEAARLAALGPRFAASVHGGAESATRLLSGLYPDLCGPGTSLHNSSPGG